MDHGLIRRMRLWVGTVIIAGILIGGLPAAAAQEPAAAPPQNTAELQQRIEATMRQHKVPGASIALVSRDAVLWSAGLGLADIASGKPVTAQTRFRIGSISKTFITLAVLQQQEAGRISLADTLRAHAPEVRFSNRWEDQAPVRLEHLLEHTAGFDDLSLPDYATEAPDVSLRDSLEQTAESLTVRWPPGRSYFYSNVGPVAAARVVENVSDQPYDQYVQERIFAPLGMSSASYFLPAETQANLATSYEADGTTVLPITNPLDWPSGTVSMTTGDMVPFIQMMLNRGSHGGAALVQPASIERMERPATSLGARSGLRIGYGLGLEILMLDGFVFYGHSGATEGFLSYFGYLPEAGLGYYMVINSSNDEGLLPIINLINTYLTKDLAKPTPPAAVAATAAELDHVTGYYELATPSSMSYNAILHSLTDIKRVSRAENGLLIGSALGGQQPVVPTGPGQFRNAADPATSIAFGTTAEGERFMQIKARSLRRVPAWVVWLRLGGSALFLLGILASLLFALIWLPRLLFGRLRGVRHINARVWPLLAGLAFLGILALLLGFADTTYVYLAKYGHPTAWSIGLCALTLLFAGSAIAGAVQALRSFRWEMRRGLRIYLALAAAINLTALGYLASWGLIGVRTWM